MPFTLQSTQTGVPKSFKTGDILCLLPAGDPVNDNIEIDNHVYRISSCTEGGNLNGTFISDLDIDHWNNAPVVAGVLRAANLATGLDLNTRTGLDAINTVSINYSTCLLSHVNGRRSIFWYDVRNLLGSADNYIGVIWAYTTSVAGQYPGTGTGYDRVLMDGSSFWGHGAAAIDWKQRFLLDYDECLSVNWNTRQMFSGFPINVNGGVGDVTVDFSKGVRPRQVTLQQRLAIPVIPDDYGLEVYQLDGTEGLYRYKSTGWKFIG